MGCGTFQFTASAVSWRGGLNEYQTHAAGHGRAALHGLPLLSSEAGV